MLFVPQIGNNYYVIMEDFSAFCKRTSLHGLQYLGDAGTHPLKKVFWFAVIIISIISAAILIYFNTVVFRKSTVLVSVETMTAPLSEIYFPSVTVCNINQARKSFFEELGISENATMIRKIHSQYFGDDKVNDHKILPIDLLKKMNASLMANDDAYQRDGYDRKKSMYWAMHQNCGDMFILSKWNGTVHNSSLDVDYDFGTDYGICCWFTPQLNLTEIINQYKDKRKLNHKRYERNPENSKTSRMGQMDIHGHWFRNIRKGATSGKHNGYKLLFDIESFDYNDYDEGSEGIKVVILHHLDVPLTRLNSFNIAPGTETQIAVTPSLTTTSPNAIRRLSAEERDCYTDSEITLQYLPTKDGYRYGMENCLFVSALENILEKCGCYPGFNYHLIQGKEVEHDLKVQPCTGSNLTCMNDILHHIDQYDHVDVNGKKMKCRSSCEDQVNNLFVTASHYPNANTFRYREEFCILLIRILQKCTSSKRQPLEDRYPNICLNLEPLSKLNPNIYCPANEWKPRNSGIENCTESKCVIEDMILSYAKNNLIMLHVLIKEPYVKRYVKDEKMPIISYIANIGGLLGLWLGFSIITGVEMVYHVISWFMSLIYAKMLERHKDDVISENNVEIRQNKTQKADLV